MEYLRTQPTHKDWNLSYYSHLALFPIFQIVQVFAALPSSIYRGCLKLTSVFNLLLLLTKRHLYDVTMKRANVYCTFFFTKSSLVLYIFKT